MIRKKIVCIFYRLLYFCLNKVYLLPPDRLAAEPDSELERLLLELEEVLVELELLLDDSALGVDVDLDESIVRPELELEDVRPLPEELLLEVDEVGLE